MPAALRSFSHAQPGQKRMHIAGMKNVFAAAAASTICRDCADVRASGFSQITCLPACRAASVWGTCSGVGTHRSTRSTASSASRSSILEYARTDAPRSTVSEPATLPVMPVSTPLTGCRTASHTATTSTPAILR